MCTQTDEPRYEGWIDDKDLLYPLEQGTISVAEMRELAGLPADCPMTAVDLVSEQEVPLLKTRCTPCRHASPGACS